MNTFFRDCVHVVSRYGLVLVLSLIGVQNTMAVNGSDLWLTSLTPKRVIIVGALKTPMMQLASKELSDGWQGRDKASFKFVIKKDLSLKKDGFRMDSTGIQSNSELGILYGVYDLLRRQQTNEPIHGIVSNPSYELRILNHWDNPDGSIERGYAGRSFFWRGGGTQLVVTDADRLLWQKYARANASIGINGSVLNNVNASPQALSAAFLQRTCAIAKELRPYGIKVYLSINFSSPAELGKLKTSDPLNPEVINWWKSKVKEVYQLIPDFGGFLVKANSEGLPGPQDFGRTHADGANMLADALKPFGGIVMWRAFVYSPSDKDRAKQAYNEFVPLDGQFRDNVIIQVKNLQILIIQSRNIFISFRSCAAYSPFEISFLAFF